MTNPAWVKGVSGHPEGKPKGTPNRITADLQHMISKALEKAGGVDYLLEQAHKNPTAFMALVGRLIPKDIRVQGQISINSVIDALLLRRAERADADALKLKDAECKVIPPAAIPGATVAKPVQVPAPGVGNTNHESSNTDTGEAKRAQP